MYTRCLRTKRAGCSRPTSMTRAGRRTSAPFERRARLRVSRSRWNVPGRAMGLMRGSSLRNRSRPKRLAKWGCFLVTETMSRRHQLSVRSYDRLFPNQDTMPKGGFGNLIALPLQWNPRRNGNTEFVDDDLQSFTDQWAFLASIARLDASLVHGIADEAARKGRVIGVKLSEMEGEDAIAPWLRRPSGEMASPALVGPFPSEAKAVLAQRLFVEKAGLSSPLISQLKRLASFQNPEFYKKQSMRFSTALTPRVISCAEDLGQHLALPRGCLGDVETLLAKLGNALSIRDERVGGEVESFTFHGSLTPLQKEAAHALLNHDTGVLVAPPGVGKTVVGAFLVAARAKHVDLGAPEAAARSVGIPACPVSWPRLARGRANRRRQATAQRPSRRCHDPKRRAAGPG